MDIKGKNGSLKISVEEIEKIGENISSFINSFFSKNRIRKRKKIMIHNFQIILVFQMMNLELKIYKQSINLFLNYRLTKYSP